MDRPNDEKGGFQVRHCEAKVTCVGVSCCKDGDARHTKTKDVPICVQTMFSCMRQLSQSLYLLTAAAAFILFWQQLV